MMTDQEFRRRFLELSLDPGHPARKHLAAFRGQDLTQLFSEAAESGRGQEWIAEQARKARAWAAAIVRETTNLNSAG